MAGSKLLVASVVILLSMLSVQSDGENADHVAPEPALRSELEAFRSKISALESSIAERAREIKIKEDSITKLEKVVEEKLEKTALLQSEVELLREKDAANAAKVAGKANAQVNELEKQIVKLKNEIGAQSKKRDALEARDSEAEKKVGELNLKLESLQKTNKEQELRIEKTRRAVEVAEQELMKAQLQATSKLKELSEVTGAWLPPWLVIHAGHIQDHVGTHWNAHAKPAFTFVLQKASEKSEQVQKWAGPHLDAAKSKWVPAVKEQLFIIQTNAEPYLQRIYSKTFEIYEASMNAISPHVVKVQGLTDPYLQEAKKISKPYIDQVVTVTKPHFEKVQAVVTPYKKRVARAYHKFLKTARTYHSQVQDNIYEELKKHELVKPYATRELAWFMASASLAFPIFFLYRLVKAVFCKKARKPIRNAHANHAPRKHKRRHADK